MAGMNSSGASRQGVPTKSGKNSLANLVAFNNSNQRVPPVLQNVGKLAAGVASVSTGGGGGGTSAAAVPTSATGSATGNPRNKCALQPGHSLMDWIRLGASGKDLTGVGAQAGRLSVTRQELALHNTKTDAWLCIREKVYNVTHYLPFHPGGPEELMKGVGKDATLLFDSVHPWVNYEQILQKCHLGRLTLMDQKASDEAEALLGQLTAEKAQEKSSSTATTTTPQSPKEPQVVRSPSSDAATTSSVATNEDTATSATNSTEPTVVLPRFDWIQKLDFITVIFYTGAFSNPAVEISQESDSTINFHLVYNNFHYNNEIVFFAKIQWPSQWIKVSCETGKIEVVFRKCESGIWDNYGVLTQKTRRVSQLTGDGRFKYLIVNKTQVNYNTVLMELERADGKKIVVPLGKHVKVFGNVDDEELARSYTPVPNCLFKKYRVQAQTTDNICLMIKRYPDGNISKWLCDLDVGDFVTISKPLGTFDLQAIERRENFIILAAGTGITPMLAIILFVLERRIRKCQSLRLLFFNRTSADILFQSQLDELKSEDPRFKVQYVLSQPEAEWTGHRGHISRSILEDTIAEQLQETSYIQDDIYVMACGPTIFTTLTHQLLSDLGFTEEQFHLFLG